MTQPTLRTDRLLLRPWRPDDLPTVYDIYSRWEVARYLGRTPTVLTEPAQAEASLARWAAIEGPLHGVWAIVPRGASVPVGSALLKLLPLSGSGTASGDTEIGWHLHPDAWGAGYATEAAQGLLAHAWAGGLDEVFAVTYRENTASQAVCRRLGMTHLGPTDRYYDLTCELFRVTAHPHRIRPDANEAAAPSAPVHRL